MTGITPRQERAVQSLLTSPTLGHAALRAGVGERTLRRWLAEDSAFKAAYREARRRVFETAVGKLAALSEEAVAELKRILTSPTARDQDKLRACHLVLMHARESGLGDIESLIEKLEAMTGGQSL
jgi:hypothetical protein